MCARRASYTQSGPRAHRHELHVHPGASAATRSKSVASAATTKACFKQRLQTVLRPAARADASSRSSGAVRPEAAIPSPRDGRTRCGSSGGILRLAKKRSRAMDERCRSPSLARAIHDGRSGPWGRLRPGAAAAAAAPGAQSPEWGCRTHSNARWCSAAAGRWSVRSGRRAVDRGAAGA